MQYGRISLIIGVGDTADSPISEVLGCLKRNEDMVIIDFEDETLHLMTEMDIRDHMLRQGWTAPEVPGYSFPEPP